MNQNAEAIVMLCSHLRTGEGIRPLEPQEWSSLARYLLEQQLEPRHLLDFSREDFIDRLHCSSEQAERLARLIGRGASLSFELSRYTSIGIGIVTRADRDYPRQLKNKLKNSCPPLFYYVGDLELLNRPCVGFAGSRAVEEQDLAFTARTVGTAVSRGFGVVSGGARGVDTASELEALRQGGHVVSYLADSMMKRIKSREILDAIQEGRALLLSAMKPDAGFQVGAAMKRNCFVYSQSVGTVVVRSDLNKGGTWAGATECLKHQWSPVFCWNRPEYPGNAALINRGAIGIDDTWDADVYSVPKREPAATWEQTSLFDQ